MGGFAEVMRARVRETRAALAAAREAGDAYAAAVAADELDDALRLARANGVAVDPAPEAATGEAARPGPAGHGAPAQNPGQPGHPEQPGEESA